MMDARTLAWTMIYGSILGIARHPRAIEDAKKWRDAIPLRSAHECSLEADEAMIEWDIRFNQTKRGAPSK